jgi:hypothetical protein
MCWLEPPLPGRLSVCACVGVSVSVGPADSGISLSAVPATAEQLEQQEALLASLPADSPMAEVYRAAFATPGAAAVSSAVETAVARETITRWKSTKV